jgi:tetratricopeptide (TPR) repeat protein
MRIFLLQPMLPMVVAACVAWAGAAHAKPEKAAKPAASAEATPQAAGEHAEAPLPDPKTLPALPKLEAPVKPVSTPEADAELEAFLGRLTSDDAKTREAAREAIAGATQPTWLGAARAKIQDIRGTLDRDKAPRIIEDARKAVREERRKAGKTKSGQAKNKSKKDDDEEEDDWLEFLQAKSKRSDGTWKEMVELLGCIRVLAAIGTTPAVREIVELRANFGDMLRVDLQRQIRKLGDKAVPALIEARRNDAQIVTRFAEIELDKLGRAIPGEAVGTSDPQVLADVLRAFGRTRDVDAVRVALSFANHERRKVRDAAREAIGAIGEPGRWQLRDAFEDLRGEKPPKSAAWDDVAKWIFHLYDRGRLAEVERALEGGFELAKAGKHEGAIAKFDDVLARDPLAPRRSEMVASYLEVARATSHDEADARLALLRKALRLDPEHASHAKTEAEIAFTEAKKLEAQGRPDAFLLRRAIELDPEHADAKQALATFDQRVVTPETSNVRWAAAGGIGASAFLIAGAIALWGRKKPRGRVRPEAAGRDVAEP